MVWLDVLTECGHGLYFESWKRTRQSRGPAAELVSGMIGDGSYEGEVLVELISDRCEVTFVDRFLDPGALNEFLRRISKEEVIEALRHKLQSVREHDLSELPLFRRDRPERGPFEAVPRGDLQVREDHPAWHPAVA
jgi:hypothetical protein